MKRFFYNPDTQKLYLCNNSHSEYYYNHKRELHKPFDFFIRGIIEKGILYLRLYYPYNDIDNKSLVEIKQFSFESLQCEKDFILKEINEPIKEIFFNVDNEQLKDVLKLQYV